MIIAALALGACASMDPEYTRARESWRGAAYDDVVQAWGPPNRIVPGSPEKHVWVTDDRVPARAPGSGVSVGVGMGRSSGSSSVGVGVGGIVFGGAPSDVVVRCERALLISEGVVVGEDWQGDAEFCKRFARR